MKPHKNEANEKSSATSSPIRTVDQLNQQARDLRHADTRRAPALSRQARDLASENDYQLGLAHSIHLIALCHFILADLSDVLTSAYQALTLFQSLDDRRGEATTLNLIALYYERRNQYKEAIHYLLKSLKIRRAIGDRQGKPGRILTRRNKYHDAREHLHRSLTLIRTIGNRHDEGLTLFELGLFHQHFREYNQADTRFGESPAIMQQTRDRFTESDILLAIGTNLLLQELFSDAVTFLQRALVIADALKSDKKPAAIHERLAEIFEKQEDHKGALQHFRAYNEALKQVHNQESERRIRTILMRPEIEKAQQEAGGSALTQRSTGSCTDESAAG